MPAPLAGLEVEREHARRVQVVTGSHFAAPRRDGVAGADVARPRSGSMEGVIQTAPPPHTARCRYPGARSRDQPPRGQAPQRRSTVACRSSHRCRQSVPAGIHRRQIPARPPHHCRRPEGTRCTHCRGQRRALYVQAGSPVSARSATTLVSDRPARTNPSATVTPRALPPVAAVALRPQRLAGPSSAHTIQLQRVEVHHAVVDDGCRLGHFGPEIGGPGATEGPDVRAGDLVEGGVPGEVEVAAWHWPVLPGVRAPIGVGLDTTAGNAETNIAVAMTSARTRIRPVPLSPKPSKEPLHAAGPIRDLGAHHRLSSPSSDAKRDVERCPSLLVFERELRPALDQGSHDTGARLPGRDMQRGLAGPVDGVDVNAAVERERHGFDLVRIRDREAASEATA